LAEIPPRADLFQLWGIVNRAVRDPELRARPGGVVQNIYAAYQQGYLRAGVEPPRLVPSDVNPLYSRAAAIYRSERELAAAVGIWKTTGLDQALTGDMMARDVDAASLSQTIRGPIPRIRYEVDYLVEGESMRFIHTWHPGLDMPQSVSELLDSLESTGTEEAANYSAEFEGLGDLISITTV
jgi:hypothetical protein